MRARMVYVEQDERTGMRNISNSEVSSWLRCRRKYYYEYMLDLEPKVLSAPIGRGTLIHAMLEQYYLNKMDGESEDTCRDAAQRVINAEILDENADVTMLGKTRDLIMGYFDEWLEHDERYEIIGVETQFSIPVPEDSFNIVGTVDLFLKDKEDGRYIGVDHKSSYNFWTEAQAQVNAQFPKYMYGLMERGFDVKAFVINQIRTRELKSGNELYRRMTVKPSESRLKAVMQQHLTAGREIMAFRADPDKDKAIPVYDKFVCANCPFFDLCDSDTEGAPLQYVIQNGYQLHKNYGYNKDNNDG